MSNELEIVVAGGGFNFHTGRPIAGWPTMRRKVQKGEGRQMNEAKANAIHCLMMSVDFFAENSVKALEIAQDIARLFTGTASECLIQAARQLNGSKPHRRLAVSLIKASRHSN